MTRAYRRPPKGCSPVAILDFHILERPISGCWLVKKSHNFGYGECTIDGKRDVTHRHAWRVYKGDIPEGMLVLHKCDVPACINPEHLFLGTNTDNLQDMTHKLRHGRMKLTIEQIRKIRKLKASGFGPVLIGREMDIPSSTIGNIFYKNSWHYVE